MTELLDPQLPSTHPRQMYDHNLRNGESITWFSSGAAAQQLIDYILGLFDLTPGDLMHAQEGFAQTVEQDVMFIAVDGPRGPALTAWGLGAEGAGRVNAAIQREWDTTLEQMGRGAYVGNPASSKYAGILNGLVAPDFEGSDVMDFLNGADVIPLR